MLGSAADVGKRAPNRYGPALQKRWSIVNEQKLKVCGRGAGHGPREWALEDPAAPARRPLPFLISID